jgi:PAS domain S-box-containing protein/putative nucleotidyltransferase with HDIG domain
VPDERENERPDQNVRVLVVEDRPEDAELVVHELRRAGFTVEWERVDTEQEYLARLNPALDAILADYTMPEFDALRALSLLKEHGLDIPFIVVSGSISEEIAVRCMKEGAADYLLKDRLARLGQAVSNALQDKKLREEKRRAEEAVRESEEKYRTLVEQSLQGLVIAQGHPPRLVFANPAMAKILGYSPDMLTELPLEKVAALVHSDDRASFFRRYKDILEGAPPTPGYEVRSVRSNGTTRWLEVSATRIEYQEEPAVQATFVDITERKQAEQELQQSLDRLRNAMEGVIQAMTLTAEVRDPHTAGHQRRVAQLACAIARELGLPDDQIEGIRMAALIHDIGKIYAPAEILSKPGELTELEFGLIKTHPQVGGDILKTVEFPWPIAQIVLQHHETLDGSGYPAGLSDPDILIEAKILAVADVVEAMSSHRPYRAALGIEKAMEEISRKRGTHYAPEVVDACLTLLTDKGFEFE